jgi:hypothetical protein
MRLGRGPCGKPRAFRSRSKLLRLCRGGRASNFEAAVCGKPEAFPKDSGKAATRFKVSSGYLLVVRQAGIPELNLFCG